MFHVQARQLENRLDIVIKSPVDKDELDQFLNQLEAEIETLNPGFVAAIDLWELRPLPPELKPYFKRTQEIILANDPSQIVSLVKSPTVRMQAHHSGQESNSNEKTRRFFEREKWVQYLETL